MIDLPGDSVGRPPGTSSTEDLIRMQRELEHELDQLRHEVTILFSDIVGSTRYVNEFGDSKGRVLLERHFELLSRAANPQRGILVKRIGDGLMFRFDSPSSAVNVACEVLQSLAEARANATPENTLHIRIGIATGKALIEREDVNGSVVNLAARLCKSAEVDGIQVSHETFNNLDPYLSGLCLPSPVQQVRGREEDNLKSYRVIWDYNAVTKARTSEVTTLILDIALEGNVLKETIRFEGPGRRTVSHRRDLHWNLQEVQQASQQITSALQKGTSIRGRSPLHDLIANGKNLYDILLTPESKDTLRSTSYEYLIISIPDTMVFIPWEVLHDGNDFLCRRFAMGRRVVSQKRPREPLRMHTLRPFVSIISDPRSSLDAARQEGEYLHAQLTGTGRLRVAMKSGANSDYVRREIRKADVLHYCGHAEYTEGNIEESGWLLSDGKLTGAKILQMSESEGSLPMVVFANACRSGLANEWSSQGESQIYGLAGSFLLAGVQHYIGTLWDVLDKPSQEMAALFYESLLKGHPVGYALREARRGVIEKMGEASLIWASYVLYGDPDIGVFGAPEDPARADRPAMTDDAKASLAGSPVLPTPLPSPAPALEHAAPASRGEEPATGGKTDPHKTFPAPAAAAWAGIILIAFIAIWALMDRFGSNPATPPPASPSAAVAQGDAGAAFLIPNPSDIRASLRSLEEHMKDPAYQKQLRERDKWTSRPLTLAILPIEAKGSLAPGSSAVERVNADLYAALIGAPWVYRIVEREKLDRILAELEIVAADLTNPGTANRLSELLSARLFMAGSLIGEGDTVYLTYRLFDAETSAIVAPDTISATQDLSSLAREAALRIGQALEAEYPVQGRIENVMGKNLYLNIGEAVGVAAGDRLSVLPAAEVLGVTGQVMPNRIADIEIADATDFASFARIISSTGLIEVRSRVLKAY